MSQLFHDKDPKFGFSDQPRTWPDDFDLVAQVDTDDLDAVFELTNHISDDWTKNPGVRAIAKHPRSTSVGDVVVNSQENVFICLPVGWKEIGKADKKIVIEKQDGYPVGKSEAVEEREG